MTATRIAAVLVLALLPLGASAEEIVVSNYGVTTNGMPYAVAMAKGFFKQQGADVTGILSSDGGGTTVRTMLGGNLAYGEINPTATVIAIQQGADLKIVSDNVQTVAEFIWAVKPDSPIRTAADLKGKKIGYTNPRSTSQALAILVLENAGLKLSDLGAARGDVDDAAEFARHHPVDGCPHHLDRREHHGVERGEPVGTRVIAEVAG